MHCNHGIRLIEAPSPEAAAMSQNGKVDRDGWHGVVARDGSIRCCFWGRQAERSGAGSLSARHVTVLMASIGG
ncbi:hypothetical protein Rhe02_33560 [Rhizocola hellebori]|uniref:Uncharacterized protein n=1 Tax=Rhizocola hellebori TaxID=1392758 RepID=A0A8J3VFE7_9ACTN|nr:hypothetical protein Rhe02_33560 [Rhizocola hellebori]